MLDLYHPNLATGEDCKVYSSLYCIFHTNGNCIIGTQCMFLQENLKRNSFLLPDFVLCDNSTPLIVQKLQFFRTELSLVAIASNSPILTCQQTCETLLSSKRSGSVFTVCGNSCSYQELRDYFHDFFSLLSKQNLPTDEQS